ncbi:hypothetical protein G6541_22805, partial [Streptomyces albidoflavus]|nr:hypothetical protein [Streptomyces albidoflavus]
AETLDATKSFLGYIASEEAGDWMDAFFAGGRGEPDPPPAGPTDPHPHDSADPPEGQP